MLSPSHAVTVAFAVAIAGFASNDEATADVVSKVAIIAVVVLESAESDGVAAAHIAAGESKSRRGCLELELAVTETEGNVEGVFIDEDIDNESPGGTNGSCNDFRLDDRTETKTNNEDFDLDFETDL